MSMTWEEAAYEEGMEALYAEHKELAIEEFTDERLQSFYVANPLVSEAPLNALEEARQLAPQYPTAAYVFAAIAIEVGLKVALLKPVVYGLVQSESVAGIITDMVIGRASVDRFRKLLFQILSEYGGVDLNTFKRSGSSKPLWEEMQEVQKRRNHIIHRAQRVTDEDSHKAISVASSILEELFPTVVKNLGFHIHENGRVCNDSRCKLKMFISEIESAKKQNQVDR